ncbi:DNA polymerase III subunit alpha [Chitinimonas sp. BJB300]|uniref:DNA polymerase III subunit alpha n=1 Tax=Chitinimonas sp. BJB300 TaxID=1559339 RepID=UPI000C1209E8|nr:DNA polymerase III subunit alpha [Chitinimonas sp. BJB300]PHV11244.1 DNA polymerase III subunit alpha [Chitinimonas sp. BJB300]TSJ88610.1 DNA polymerase III subunit alpha [Chitinimonas sp. BJB300]
MTSPAFIHLRLHSEYSITDGIVRIDDAVQRAKQLGIPAVAVTDLMNLFGMVKQYKTCRGSGIKPIAGVDVWIENEDDRDKPFRALLLARNRAGYGRLCELITQAYRHNQYRGRAELKRAWLAEGSNADLIALSGAHLGDIGQAILNGNQEAAASCVKWWISLFPGNFYLELQRTGDPRWEAVVQMSLMLAADYDLPVVATHPIQFLDPDDFKAHEARTCIAEGYVLADKRRPKRYTEQQYFKSPDEMANLFADLPEALANTVEIAKRCNLHIVLGKNFLPLFPTPDGMGLDDFLIHESKLGLEERLLQLYPDPVEREARRLEYEVRLKFECDTIIKMGFPGYFLIVADFIKWGKANGCPVGPGRGSGAGSLVAYSLSITDLDPLKYALLFERFLNPERVSMPDFDVDFCQENRWRVIEYVRQKYGEEAVSQIATFGTMSSKSVVRDIGRVLDLPFFLCDKLSKLIPLEANKPLPLAKAMEAEPQIGELIEAEDAGELLELALKLEDLTRGIGMHAGGVLIAPGKLTDFCPLYIASGEGASPVSQFDKDDVEQAGLVKFDFLGLRNLTIIELAQKYIKQLSGEDIDVAKLSLEDAPAYRIFATGNTTAVFQFESTGMKKMLVDAKPKQFEEIIAFVALYRPGPMDLIPDFTRRMHGEKFEYLHPLLAPVLAPTYGIMVYQEQVMQAAQVCGGYSLGGADLLRRAMGKKKLEEMVAQRAMFVEGAAKQQISEAKANEIFDYMEKFAGYGFNKSHAAAYALVAYHTAWLKAHHCAAYMSATMSTELDNTDQLKVFYDDCVFNKLKFLPPDVNHSVYRFLPVSRDEIRYALGAIKGTGEAAVEYIISVREKTGPFKDLFDFCHRTDKRIVNRRVIEALIRGGAFDALCDHRASLLASVGMALEAAEQASANIHQGGLFDAFEPEPEHVMQLVEVPRWTETAQLTEEKTAIGFYLSGHPFTAQAKFVRGFVKTELARLVPNKGTQWITGVVLEIRTKIGQRGKIAFVTLDDATTKRDVMVYAETLESARHSLREDTLVVIEAKVSEDTYGGGGGLRIIAERVLDLAEARSRFAKVLSLGVNSQADAIQLRRLLDPYRGGDCPIRIQYRSDKVSCAIALGEGWKVTLRDELLTSLRKDFGREAVQVQY